MAQSILIFDFGTNEEVAQQARHKIEAWQQAMRLGKRLLFKFEREEVARAAGGDAAATSGEAGPKAKAPKKKAAAGANKQKASSDGANTAPAGRIRLLVRLGFSDHEKLTQQRLVDRLLGEEPFKSMEGQTITQGSPSFAETADLFDSLD